MGGLNFLSPPNTNWFWNIKLFVYPAYRIPGTFRPKLFFGRLTLSQQISLWPPPPKKCVSRWQWVHSEDSVQTFIYFKMFLFPPAHRILAARETTVDIQMTFLMELSFLNRLARDQGRNVRLASWHVLLLSSVRPRTDFKIFPAAYQSYKEYKMHRRWDEC